MSRNTGPGDDKASLLALDSLREWISCCRPKVIGRTTVQAGQVFADIFGSYDESNESGSQCESDEWIDGVGEGRTDDENISLYFRMSEGSEWNSGNNTSLLFDLTKYGNCGQIISPEGTFELQKTTSPVDEGETGRVKPVHDLVFTADGRKTVSGLAVVAKRGSSLDLGVFAGRGKDERQKYTIEFWFFVPNETIEHRVILARKTAGKFAGDMSVILDGAQSEICSLWDLIMLPSGEVELWTSGQPVMQTEHTTPDPDGGSPTFCSFGKWNHIAVVFNSRRLDHGECDVSIFLRGEQLATSRVSFILPNSLHGTPEDAVASDSHFIFGIDHCIGYRMTELRIWACERSQGDISSFMYEYHNCAEVRRKLRVNITSDRQKLSGTTPNGGRTMAKPSPAKSTSSSFSLAPSTASKRSSDLATAPSFDVTSLATTPVSETIPEPVVSSTQSTDFETEQQSVVEVDDEDVGLWDGAVPLSELMRPSTAAAFVRGPPATRLFGGNRGGLPDSLESLRLGVGGVAIAGPERTVVWRDDPEPVVNSYPIGASGAIVSDILAGEGSEFVCLFHAKERSIVVYKLATEEVVVELEMTTKLSFWRFLPPEADSNVREIMVPCNILPNLSRPEPRLYASCS